MDEVIDDLFGYMEPGIMMQNNVSINDVYSLSDQGPSGKSYIITVVFNYR